MTTRRTEPTHEADQAPRDAAPGNVESPSADQFQGSSGPLHQPDADDANPAGDQDIDTAAPMPTRLRGQRPLQRGRAGARPRKRRA